MASASAPVVNPTNVSQTLSSAVSSGIISAASQTAIQSDLDDMTLLGCNGISIDDIDSERVTLVTVMIDASSSMLPHRDALIKAYEEILLAPLRKAANARSILLSTWVFSADPIQNEKVRLFHGFTPIPDCKPITENEYAPDGMTPLRDAAMKGITGLVTYGQTLRDNGTQTKSIVIVMSDGGENSSRTSASKIKTLAADVLHAQEFVLAYIYFSNAKDKTQAAKEGDIAAKEIGFPAQHRLTEELGEKGIRRALGTVSASVISTSQTQVSASSLSSNAFFANGR